MAKKYITVKAYITQSGMNRYYGDIKLKNCLCKPNSEYYIFCEIEAYDVWKVLNIVKVTE